MVSGIKLKAEAFKEAAKQACSICLKAQQTNLPFEAPEQSSTATLELVHSDVLGLLPVATPKGKLCIVTVLDDYSSFSMMDVLRSKKEIIESLSLIQ